MDAPADIDDLRPRRPCCATSRHAVTSCAGAQEPCLSTHGRHIHVGMHALHLCSPANSCYLKQRCRKWVNLSEAWGRLVSLLPAAGRCFCQPYWAL